MHAAITMSSRIVSDSWQRTIKILVILRVGNPSYVCQNVSVQSSLEQFVKAAEVFPAAIVIADAEGRIVLVNGNTETMFGYRRDELIGQTIEILIPERYRDRHVHHRYDYNSAPRTRLMGLGLDLVGRRKNW